MCFTAFSNSSSVASSCCFSRTKQNRHLESDTLRIDGDDAAADDALPFHLLDAPPAGRVAEADALADLGDRELRLALQQPQDLAARLVHAAFAHLTGAHG
jgi:hypothetical protein